MAESQVARHSVWLVPDGEAHRRLSEVIRRIAGEYGSPTFEPHITLVSGVRERPESICQKIASVVQGIGPIEVRLDGIGVGKTRFQSVFALVQDDPALSTMVATLRQAFPGHTTSTGYPLHLSLVYGEFGDDIKREIIAGVGREAELVFPARAVSVYRTEGATEAWTRVGQVPLI